MSISLTILLGLVMGLAFGFILEKSRVFEPGFIIAQFQLRKFIMLKVFLTAIITSLIVFGCFFSLGFERLNWKITIYTADLLGGGLLGIGVALAGACPGTLFAQLGAGYKDSIATLIGALFGAFAFIKLNPWLQLWLLNGKPHQKLTLDGLLNLSFSSTAIILVLGLMLLLYILERLQPWRQELQNNFDGCN